MAITKERKSALVNDFKQHDGDTGSSGVQVAMLTERINNLSEHFKTHKKDHHSRLGLLKLVSLRRRLLDYLKQENESSYQDLVKRLNLRK